METTEQQALLRNKARDHFQYFVDNAERFQLKPSDAQRDADIALQMVDHVLALAPGAPFSLASWAQTHNFGEVELRSMFQSMPALCGFLGLLKMEFEYPPVGKLPLSVVQALIKKDAPVTYQGHTLTSATVQVVYYRRALT